jgi:two-component system, OmpR family, response regulator
MGEATPKKRILVTEENPATRRMLQDHFESLCFTAIAVSTRQAADDCSTLHGVSLVLLDLRLDRTHGLAALRQIRSRSDVPIIITANGHCDEADRVLGLELGADDYVMKPFSIYELSARVRAVLRRRSACVVSEPTPKQGPGQIRFGDWLLDLQTRSLTDRGGAALRLTKGEYALLIAFLDAPRQVHTREHLVTAIGMHEDIFDKSIDVRVCRLRRKLAANSAGPNLIRTERGTGYSFSAPVERL